MMVPTLDILKQQHSVPDHDLEQIFIDFLNGDRSAKIYNFAYSGTLGDARRSHSAGVDSWDKLLDRNSSYYIFPNEARLMEVHADSIVAAMPYNPNLIELGTGSGKSIEQKTLPFLRALKPQRYIANDLSLKSIMTAEKIVRRNLPHVDVETHQADFLDENSAIFSYPPANVLMTGSTISNITSYDGYLPVNEVITYLRKLGKILGRNGHLVITQDTNQDEDSLKKAYTSPAFVQFRKDTLHRLKERLNLTSFDPSTFHYEPVWEPRCNLLTTTFVNTKDQTIQVGDKKIYIPEGRRVYASNCYKYPLRSFQHMARIAGLKPVKTWMDAENRVALHVLTKSQ
jgi:L-histidine Nalpha-methyltransferase